jgi:hypothetical protein
VGTLNLGRYYLVLCLDPYGWTRMIAEWWTETRRFEVALIKSAEARLIHEME